MPTQRLLASVGRFGKNRAAFPCATSLALRVGEAEEPDSLGLPAVQVVAREEVHLPKPCCRSQPFSFQMFCLLVWESEALVDRQAAAVPVLQHG